MKRIYWRPQGASRTALVLIALLAVSALIAVEKLPSTERQPWYAEKLSAARVALSAMRAIKAEKVRRGLPIDAQADPTGSGMIGSALTPVTSNTGYLSAKRTSVNPNFAAILLGMFKRAGVQQGDVVAVGLSGSFPALNVAAFAAMQTLQLKPIVISSAASSEWGANQVEYMWLDMERTLFDQRVFSFRSVAASRGGIDDRGLGLSSEGQKLIDECVARNGLRLLAPESLREAIDQHMEVYDEHAGARPIRAYVNIGGGTASVGTAVGKKQFSPGVNFAPPRGKRGLMDSVMLRFSERAVPVIHVTGIVAMARQYALPIEPQTMPKVGDSTVFSKAAYNRWLALAGLVLVLTSMIAFIRFGLAGRLLTRTGSKNGDNPEPMI